MVTVHDVARVSGVSIATVSRTLREPERVLPGTRDRVMAAIEQLDYRPNRAAIGLRRGRTGAIALIVPDIENPYFASLTKGAQATSRAGGYGLVIVDTTESPAVERAEIAALEPQVDGLIIVSSRLPEAELRAIAATTSCVLINRVVHDATTPTLAIAEGEGARLAVEHLRDFGHRRIGYVGGPPQSWTDGLRWAGLQAAAAESGLELTHLGSVTPDAGGGHAAADAALDADVSAVIGYNDLVALGLLAEWTRRGIRVPERMSLIGFDDTFVAGLSSPALTSVGADLRTFGSAAATLLLARIDRAEEPHAGADQPMRLVARGSTGPVADGS